MCENFNAFENILGNLKNKFITVNSSINLNCFFSGPLLPLEFCEIFGQPNTRKWPLLLPKSKYLVYLMAV